MINGRYSGLAHTHTTRSRVFSYAPRIFSSPSSSSYFDMNMIQLLFICTERIQTNKQTYKHVRQAFQAFKQTIKIGMET